MATRQSLATLQLAASIPNQMLKVYRCPDESDSAVILTAHLCSASMQILHKHIGSACIAY